MGVLDEVKMGGVDVAMRKRVGSSIQIFVLFCMFIEKNIQTCTNVIVYIFIQTCIYIHTKTVEMVRIDTRILNVRKKKFVLQRGHGAYGFMFVRAFLRHRFRVWSLWVPRI